jgi:ribosomal protein L7/L12
MLTETRLEHLALKAVTHDAVVPTQLTITQRSMFEMLKEFGRIVNREAEDASSSRVTIRSLLTDGMFINAIKRYREETGADLRTAKEAVETIQKDLGL